MLAGLRVVDDGDLERQIEEALVDEQIAIRQEDAEPRVGVEPAHDLLVGVPLVHLLVHVIPRLVRERQLRALLFGVERVDDRLDADERPRRVLQHTPDEDATDLHTDGLLASRRRLVEAVLRDVDPELLLHRGELPVAEVGERDLSDVEVAHDRLRASSPSCSSASPSKSHASRSASLRKTTTS